VPVNWVPIVGATVIRRATLDAMTPATREAVLAAAGKAGAQVRAHRDALDRESIAAMQQRGLAVRPVTPEIEKAWRATASEAWPLVRGSMVPAETFDRVQAELAAYRAGRK
jgi:TRAP-type C4-dicarboxylate transport system substrate-binding protein